MSTFTMPAGTGAQVHADYVVQLVLNDMHVHISRHKNCSGAMFPVTRCQHLYRDIYVLHFDHCFQGMPPLAVTFTIDESIATDTKIITFDEKDWNTFAPTTYTFPVKKHEIVTLRGECDVSALIRMRLLTYTLPDALVGFEVHADGQWHATPGELLRLMVAYL